MIDPLNAMARDFLAICAFALSEPIVHQTVAQAHGILGLWENHAGGKISVGSCGLGCVVGSLTLICL